MKARSVLLASVVAACGGGSATPDSSTPDSATPDSATPPSDARAPDAVSPPPDAAVPRYAILYTRWNDGPEIVAGTVEGGEILPLRKLDGGAVLASQAAVSADGTRLAFTSFTWSSSTWAVIVRPIAGTEADEVVVAQTIGGAAMPAWSHDGTRIAYVSFTGAPFTYGVYVVDATGGRPRQLATVVVGDADQAPCIAPQWSPDDGEIAFSTITGLASHVFADDRVRDLLPLGTAPWTCAPRWSPDGTSLAFALGGLPGQIARIARTGGEVTSLAPMLGGMGAGQVKWSPDGTRVVFVDYDYDESSAALRVTDPAGGPPVRLDILDSGIIGGHPTWSPDGEEVLYTRFEWATTNALLSRIRPVAGSSRVDLGLVGATLDGAYPTWLATPVPGSR